MNKIFRTIIDQDRTRFSSLPANNAAPRDYMKVMVRDLNIDMMIGVYDSEKVAPQPVVINLEAIVREHPDWRSDQLDTAVCYATIVARIEEMAAARHYNLVETLVNEVADDLMKDERITQLLIRAEKTKAIASVKSVGIEILRCRD